MELEAQISCGRSERQNGEGEGERELGPLTGHMYLDYSMAGLTQAFGSALPTNSSPFIYYSESKWP